MLKKQFLLPIFLLVQIIGLRALTFFPEFVEKYYSNGLYPNISMFSRRLLGKIPFSFGDVIYGILIIYIIFWILKNWKTHWKIKTISILSFVSVAYFLFHFLWAFNYYRIPLSKKMNLKTDYTDAQLLNFTKKLIVKTNEIQFQITKDSSKKVINIYNQDEIFHKSILAYTKLSDQYSFFKYENSSQKKSLFSLPLTYMGFGGYLNPFTNEAQVNDRIPMYNFAFTTCHEMAHQIGHGSESECNFIGFLAVTNTNNLYFKYAGYSNALRYCLYNWEVRNPEMYTTLEKSINTGVLKNYEESRLFWENHQTFIETGFKIFYDNFLKLNQQKDGLESYSKFVDLMVNYYEKKNL